ncbi:hypothetical protein EON67_07590, partial [archaeon]
MLPWRGGVARVRRRWRVQLVWTLAVWQALIGGSSVHAENVISTVAGGGFGLVSAATSAMLRNPSGVSAVANASSGRVTLFIADREDHRVHRVDEDGVITHVAGTGVS